MYKSTENLEFNTYLDHEGRTICRCAFLKELHQDMAATAMYWPIANAISWSVGMTHFENSEIDWSALEEWAREEAPYLMEEDEEDPDWEVLSGASAWEDIPHKYMPPDAKYRWAVPGEWLVEKAKSWDLRDLALAAWNLADLLDPEDAYTLWGPDLPGLGSEFESEHDWVQSYISRMRSDGKALQRVIAEMANHLGSDAIQDVFEREMEWDDYFIPIIKCNCGKE